MFERIVAAQGSVTVKVLFIAFLVLLLLIPVSMIEGLIRERVSLQQVATQSIMSSWGKAQTIAGPILSVPYREVVELKSGQRKTRVRYAYFMPQYLSIQGRLEVELRYRGIYEIPVYTADLTISGRFAVPDFSSLGIEAGNVLWSRAFVAVPITDARPINRALEFELSGRRASFEPGGVKVPGFASQVVVPWARLASAAMTQPATFNLSMNIGGSGNLNFLPLGNQTDISLESNWARVGFMGAYLPRQRSLSDSGFSAQWTVLNLGRGFPGQWRGAGLKPAALKAASFGVRLLTPAGQYSTTVRAAKYAVLFLGLVFLGYFLFEIFAELRLHPLQYVLTGFANIIFYLLLLSLSEHLAFGWAYGISALACTGLISAYSANVLRARARAWMVFAVLSVLYVFLYIVLKAEDYALLMGAGGLFIILASVMFITRNIDWYTLNDRQDGKASPMSEGPA